VTTLKLTADTKTIKTTVTEDCNKISQNDNL